MTCQTLIIACIDFRFQDKLRTLVNQEGLRQNYDLVTVAGGIKDLIGSDSAAANFIMKQIKISRKLHQITEIYLCAHEDCGAYGGKSAFSSDELELARHKLDLTKAKHKISLSYPEVSLKTYFLKLDCSWLSLT